MSKINKEQSVTFFSSKILKLLLVALVLILGFFFFFAVPIIEKGANGIVQLPPYKASQKMIRRMEEKGMIVDLAHASKQTIDDVLAMAKRPVVVSHTGVKGTCDNNRNLSDSQLKAIAANGGLIGVGFWDAATCGTNASSIADAIKYTADRIGVNHIALGSDFDGAVNIPFDTTGIVLITDALIQKGFSDEDIGKIMGGNEIKFLLDNLLDK